MQSRILLPQLLPRLGPVRPAASSLVLLCAAHRANSITVQSQIRLFSATRMWQTSQLETEPQTKVPSKDQNEVKKEVQSKVQPNSESTTPSKVPSAPPAVQPASQVKLTIWQKVKKEAKHYWEGTKLLGYEVKVSTKLALKMGSGRELTRREDRQLRRTLQDIARLVPFAMFVLVPFAELLLPLALKIFPNLLPSTYETATARTARSKKLGDTRSRMGEYLRKSVRKEKFAVPEFTSEAQRLVFEGFFAKVRDGEQPSDIEILEVARMFKDDMLLDNLSRPQLAAVANYMGIKGFGTSNILRYQIRHKMRIIRQDDRVILDEGVDSLNAIELQAACQSRGFKTIGISTGRLRDDLSTWLQLRLRDRVPCTLLILSSAYNYGVRDLDSTIDALLAVLSALPPEVYHETELEIQNEKATNAQRLEVLKEQDELIREENKEEQESGHVVQVRDNLNVDDVKENEPHQDPEDVKDTKSVEEKVPESKTK
ncbi:Ylh47 protein [Starmerella bacillaris]|uniref:Ylh47 protein n=1 Tax=Starmerella bacillaris TaxID=1247836 RepID=A0AAV5RDE6_STABA|nr:Ylh47 protein [Starmerella bacillaris]